MAGSRDVRAGGAYVELLTKDGALRKGLDNAAKTLQKWGNGISALGKTFLKIGTAAIAPLAATTKVFASMGDEVAKAATRTGVSVEKISALKYAADQSGSSLEDLEGGLRHMSKTVVGAAKGSAEAAAALGDVGLEVKDLQGLSPDEQFSKIADALSGVADPTEKAARAMAIFGKGGASLIPLMDGGAAGINELTEQAKRLGLVWSTQDAKAAEEFGDRLDDLWKVVKKLVADVGSALVPIFRKVAVAVTDGVVAVSKWVKENGELIRTALFVAAGVVAAGASFLILGYAISGIGTILAGVSTAMGVVGGVLGFLLSPVGLVVAALVGLGVYFLKTSDAGKEAMDALGRYFGELKEIATGAFQGIKDALAAGDWKLAVEVLWAGLKAAWLTGILPLQTAWENFKALFVKTAVDAFDGMLAGWEIARSALTEGFTKMTSQLSQIWNAFAAGVKNTFERLKAAAPNALLDLGVGGQTARAAGLGFDQKGLNDDRDAAIAATNAAELAAAKEALDLEEKRLAAERKRHDERMAAIRAENKALHDAADKNATDAIASAEAAATGARAKLVELQKKAAAEASDANKFDMMGFLGIPSLEDIQEAIRKAAAGVDAVTNRTVGTKGTINSLALSSLSAGGGIQERIAKFTEETAKNTKKIASKPIPTFT